MVWLVKGRNGDERDIASKEPMNVTIKKTTKLLGTP
jgi:hypothetical protein